MTLARRRCEHVLYTRTDIYTLHLRIESAEEEEEEEEAGPAATRCVRKRYARILGLRR